MPVHAAHTHTQSAVIRRRTLVYTAALFFLWSCARFNAPASFLAGRLATAGIVVADTGGITSVTEGGAGDVYIVSLNTAPVPSVTLLAAFDNRYIKINGSSTSPASITLDGSNYAGQSVLVTAYDDFLAEGNHSTTISHTVTTADPSYLNQTAGSIAVVITDNDTAGVSVVESGGFTRVTEGGATDTYTINLTTQPFYPVTINITANAQITVAPVSLVFDDVCPGANCWNVAKTVTVTAVDDITAEGNHTGSITHAGVSADAAYNGIGIVNVTPTVIDNDTRITNVFPADNMSVGANVIPISVTFSEAMTVASITTNTANNVCSGSFQVSSDNFGTCVQMTGAPVASCGNTVFTVTPAAALSASSTFKVRITTSVKNAGGGLLSVAFTSAGFLTSGAPDVWGPSVTTILPADGAPAAPTNSALLVLFSEPMLAATVDVNTLSTACTGAIQVSTDGFVTCLQMAAQPTPTSGNTVFLVSPLGGFAPSTLYAVRVTTGAQDLAGNALLGQYDTMTGITTAAGTDLTAPTVSAVAPANGAGGVPVGTSIQITFSEAVRPDTVTTNFSNSSCSGVIQLSADNFLTCVRMTSQPTAVAGYTVYTVQPAANLAGGTTYKVRVTTGPRDMSYNAMAATYTQLAGFSTP